MQTWGSVLDPAPCSLHMLCLRPSSNPMAWTSHNALNFLFLSAEPHVIFCFVNILPGHPSTSESSCTKYVLPSKPVFSHPHALQAVDTPSPILGSSFSFVFHIWPFKKPCLNHRLHRLQCARPFIYIISLNSHNETAGEVLLFHSIISKDSALD